MATIHLDQKTKLTPEQSVVGLTDFASGRYSAHLVFDTATAAAFSLLAHGRANT